MPAPQTAAPETAAAAGEVFARVAAGYPLLVLNTAEERRWVAALAAAAPAAGKAVSVWSAAAGVRGAGETPPAEPELPGFPAFLRTLPNAAGGTLHVLTDAGPHLADPLAARLLREALPALAANGSAVLLVAPHTPLPDSLQSDAADVDLPPPGPAELGEELAAAAKLAGADPPAGTADRLVNAARGLTRDAARRAFTLALRSTAGDVNDADPLDAVVNEKRRLVRGGDLLEFRGLDERTDAVGGLHNLKEWLKKRAAAFSPEAQARGVPAPRGVLLLGVQGCGKSLTARVAARILGFPLIRLDVAALLAGEVGKSEANLRRALASVAAVAPAVLWLDELEKGFAGSTGDGGGASDSAAAVRRMTGTLLTWMEDRPAPVFVAATANAVDALPPELLRRGRFDELFFIDLPNDYERRDILEVHLTRGGLDPEQFDLTALADLSEGHSGAELAEAVTTARIDAHTDGRSPSQDDFRKAIEETVPLSVTMEDQIFALREWAKTRCRPATPDSRVLRMLEKEKRLGHDAEPAGDDLPAFARLAAGGQVRAAITEYLTAQGGVTFPELIAALDPHTPTAGPLGLALKGAPHAVIWAGLDEGFAGELAKLVDSRRVYLHPHPAADHPDGAAPPLPAHEDRPGAGDPPDRPYWRPVKLKTVPRPGGGSDYAKLTRVRLAKK